MDGVGATSVAPVARVEVGIAGSTFARCVESVAGDGSTATEARRVTAGGRSVIASGVGSGGLIAGRNCHPPQPTAIARTAAAALGTHGGTIARVTAGHHRQPSREAG